MKNNSKKISKQSINEVDVSVVIVGYNCEPFLRPCLDSLQADIKASGLKVEVIVVNNATDNTRKIAKEKKYAWAKWVDAVNRGFGAGQNEGMKVAEGEYFFLLNPDTEIKKGTLKKFYDYLQKDSRIGLVGPKLLFGDGSLQISAFDNFPRLFSGWLENTLLDRVGYWLFPETNYPGKMFSRSLHSKERQVAHLLGAALFMRREIYDVIGGFDEQFFMFREETDWMKRISEAGWEIWYNPKIVVIHYEGGSTDQSRRSNVWMRKLGMYLPSVYKYQKKWFGILSAYLLICFYFFGSMWTLFVLGLILIINNTFGLLLPKFRDRVNNSVRNIAIYHWAVISWHVLRWIKGESVFG